MNIIHVAGDLGKVRGDLEDTRVAMSSLWGRADSEVLGQLIDARTAIEALTRAVSSLTLAVERLAEANA